MELIFWDTEFTAWEGSQERGWSEPHEHRELVQIGAVKLVLNEKQLTFTQLDVLDVLVKPKINLELSGYFIELTGITQQELDDRGVPVAQALKQLKNFCGDVPLHSWGRDDIIVEETCKINQLPLPLPTAQYKNVHQWLKDKGLPVTGINCGTTYRLAGLEEPQVEGQLHNALYDARVLAQTFEALLQQGVLTVGDFAY